MTNEKINSNDEIDLLDLFNTLWKRKFLITLVSFLFSVSAVIYSLNLPNIYESHAILASSKSTGDAISSKYNQIVRLASSTGFDIPATEIDSDVAMSIEIIKSLDFFDILIKKYDLLFALEAPNGWDRSTNSLKIDPKKYDTKNNKWIIKSSLTEEGIPSLQSAHRAFLKNLNISIVKESGLISISFKHYSPFIAKKVVNSLINEINNISKLEDILIAEESIDFLKAERNKTQLSEIRNILDSMIQSQIETITIANVSSEYVFKILSAPHAPEIKSKPDRKVIVIIGTILGLILSTSYVLIRKYIFPH